MAAMYACGHGADQALHANIIDTETVGIHPCLVRKYPCVQKQNTFVSGKKTQSCLMGEVVSGRSLFCQNCQHYNVA